MDVFIRVSGIVPYNLTQGVDPSAFSTLVTSLFLHGGLIHIGGQHALSVDLREQHRGFYEVGAFHSLLPRRLQRGSDLVQRGARPRYKVDETS